MENAYHALALDEKRKNFAPTLWMKSKNTIRRSFTQTLEQRWFAGVHGNIGGGYPDEGLSDITLNWMISRAAHCDLAFDLSEVKSEVKPNDAGMLYNSRWGLFALLPAFIRPVDKEQQTVDPTVFDRISRDLHYRPANIVGPPEKK